MSYEGKHSAGTKKKGAVWLVILAIVLVVAVAVGLIVFLTADSGEAPQKIENRQETVLPDDEISTPYMEFAYPGMWTDRVTHEVVKEGNDVKIIFTADLDGAQAQLFTVCFGAVPEQGYVMGQLKGENGVQTDVSVVMNTIQPDASWSEETVQQMQSLQESVNDLLLQLQENPDFTPAS